MANLSQDTRVGKFQTVLGKDKLGLTGFKGQEGFSELFEFRVNCLSDEKKLIDFDDLLGTDCHVEIATRHEGVSRYFHGVIAEAKFQDYVGGLSGYKIVLRPWLWLLSRTRNCRIFNDKTVLEIVQEVLGQYGYAHFDIRTGDYWPKLEYCVQYRESDFDFVSRLLESIGLYYYFEHSENQHLMVINFGAGGDKPKGGGPNVVFDPTDQKATRKGDFFDDFLPKGRFYNSKVSLNDFDYKKPKADLLVNEELHPKFEKRDLEFYDYPGGYTETSDGKEYAIGRLNSVNDHFTAIATGDALTCYPGTVIQLKQHPEESYNVEHLVCRVHHDYKSDNYLSGAGNADGGYHGRYEINLKNFFAPRITTSKPIIPGPQTAFVVSEMDDQTRLKVLFHWERDKKHSRYVRIGHGWAGAGWGDFKIPRIGMEVIVEFLNGDPDYPLITGCVYNGDNKPPFDTPTISGTKSQNYHNGSGYNEFIFDDKDGAQLVRLHAEKDMEGVIENNETRSVGMNSTHSIGMNSSLKVGNALTETIGISWTVTSGTNISFVCGASSIVMTPAGIVITSPNIAVTTAAAMAVTTGGAFALTSGGAVAITAAAAVAIVAGGPALFHGIPPIVA